ncbi:hypothetical protein CAEBREN_14294 [Caenorhabditis brenneri]|uniref:Uncharacterized protein n=1 Tax=Caenorhabditis brenneri TaxID=135651 RepID=G0PHS1_CAEBE|nr:hypothetical protein CAEBREN_14294 [Caenorhabditis brenneri]
MPPNLIRRGLAPHIEFGLRMGYIGYVRVPNDEEEVPPAPLIASSEPEIGPGSGAQRIEPAAMEVVTNAVNVLSPGGSGAPVADP